IGIDFDLDYGNEMSHAAGPGRPVRGKLIAAGDHPIGTGFLAAPFVFLGSLIDRASGHPVIEDRKQYVGSWAYFGFCLSVSLYFLLSLFLMHACARLLWPDFANGNLMILMVLSCGILYYTLGIFPMSHVFEVAAISFTLYLSLLARTREAGAAAR